MLLDIIAFYRKVSMLLHKSAMKSALKYFFLENYSVKCYIEAKCYVRDQKNNPRTSFTDANIRDPVQ